MAEDIWAETPEPLPVGWAETLYYSKPDLDAFHEKLKGKITQLHECLGEYQSKEWCGHCIVDSKCVQITMHIIELKKKAETLTFLFGEKGVKTENLMKIQAWREKAEKYDELMNEPERCGYFKPGYGCDSPVGIGNSVMCRKLPNCEILEEESVFKTLLAVKTWLIKAKAEGRISMSSGFTLDRILGVEE